MLGFAPISAGPVSAFLALALGVDATNPTLTGVISISALTSSGYIASCPVAGDDVGVVGYQYRLNSGSWISIAAGGRAISISGRTAGATDALDMRAVDGAGNVSEVLSKSIVLLEEFEPPAPAGTTFDTWLNRVLPYVPGCPEDTALLHIIDAAKEYCRRTLVYNYQHAEVLTVAGQSDYLLTLPAGLRLTKVMGCQIGNSTVYAVQGGSLGRSLQRNAGGNVCLLEDPRTIVLSPAPTQSGLPIVVDIAVMPTDAGTAVWPDSLEDHIEYIAAGAIGSLCAMPEKAAGWRDLQSSIDNRAKFNARIAALKVQLSRSEVWSARAKTVWF